MITVLCRSCRLLVQTSGEPFDAASIFDAARRIGWRVVDVYCYCPECSKVLDDDNKKRESAK